MNCSKKSTQKNCSTKKGSLFIFGAQGKMGRMVQQLLQGDEELELVTDSPDAILDFSSPSGTLAAIELALKWRVPLVSGTTGLGAEHFEKLREASKEIAVMHSPNFSVGMAALFSIAEQLKELPGAHFEVRETHHIHKKDAPSGTALKLQKLLDGAPTSWERKGEVVGIHEVIAKLAGEELVLRHEVKSRETFAQGALLAVKSLLGKPAGWYEFLSLK